MNAADPSLQKFQRLLRELFQFDCQDLDFGIYRVLNYKRNQIEEFINERLPRNVTQAFAGYAAADRTTAERELEEKRHELVSTLGTAAFDSAGQLAPEFRNTPLGKQFLELEQKAKAGRVADELQASVYNDLYAFFSRYYEDGDIFSKPRRGKVEIPFTGDEDVVLHWSNRDQYYIKTGEQFKNYRFRAGDFSVEFALRNVPTEPNKNEREKRYFIIAQESAVTFDSKTGTAKVLFEYRSLSDGEKIAYGTTELQKPQDKLNLDAEKAILSRVKEPTLTAYLAKPLGENRPSLLLHHLTRFSRKNTTDFFIHKDLRGFLSRELDDFLKTDIIHTHELLTAEHPDVSRRALLRAQVVRRIAGQIIDFQGQVEDFQKKVFEKRKFVVRTEYCITLDRLPEALWEDVLKNKAQMEEWRRLYALDDLLKAGGLFNRGLTKEFLHKHPHLVVDTRHFPEEFKSRLLAAFDDLDASLDGLLIKSENFQALTLLLAKYRQRVNFVHIDPPYNTETSGFIYKNNYQHSSWLAMMENRVWLGWLTLRGDGAFACHIDENEYEALHKLCEELGIPIGGTVVWDKKNPMLGRKGIATQHEYVLWLTDLDSPVYLRPKNVGMILAKAREIVKKHEGVNDKSRREFAAWIRSCQGLTGGERAYCLLDDDGRVFQSVSMEAPEPRTDPKFFIPLAHPVTKKKCPVPSNGWSRAPETIKELLARNDVLFGIDESVQPRRKVFLTEESRRQLASVISDASRGKNDLDKLGLEFPYCHPVSLYEELTGAGAFESDAIVFDFFAGSGTSGHAVINLNREDGGARKYVLAESEDYFDSILLPRLKKVVYCSEWKEGKPAGGKGVSHFLKYLVLEQYEDALNNLEFQRAKEGELALQAFGDEYLLRYMLEFETQNSPSLLALDRLRHPFDYKLKVLDGDESVERTVDLVETFNYLLGLDVKKLREMRDGQRVYRAVLGQSRKGENVVIIWRDLDGLEDDKEALQKDRHFIESKVLPPLLGKEKKSDRLLINGECVVEGAVAIEPELYRLMFAPIA